MIKKLKDCLRWARVRLLRARVRCTAALPALPGTTLIVAPHPDDEILGCGGLIAHLCAQGNPPHVAIMTRGEGSHHGCCDLSAQAIGDARHELTLAAAQIVGLPADHIRCVGSRDGGIPSAAADCRELRTLVEELQPRNIFVPHWGEGWPDHLNTRLAVREMVAEMPEVTVYEYCVWMWYYMVRGLDLRNARVLRLTEAEHERKVEAARAYVTPCAPCGRPWSGVLPRVFVRACLGERELYFKSPL